MSVSVPLERADIALLSDIEATRIQLPRLRAAAPTNTREGVRTRFSGDTLPTPFRGEGRDRTIPLVARFLASEQQTMVDVIALFDMAHDAVDGRLLLRTHLGLVAGFDPTLAVVVFDDSVAPVDYGSWDLSFTAMAVEWSVEV